MRLSKGKIIGLLCVLAAVAVVGGVFVFRAAQPEPAAPVDPVEVTGYLGGEKISLFEDEEFGPPRRRGGARRVLPQGRLARHDGGLHGGHGLPLPLVAGGRRVRRGSGESRP